MGMTPREERAYRLRKLALRSTDKKASATARRNSKKQMADLLADYFPDVVTESHSVMEDIYNGQEQE